MRIGRLALLALALLAGEGAMAGGFQVNLASQKNNAMGHVGTGLALDQGSIFFNPGALTFVRDRGVVVGASVAIARTAYRNEQGQDYLFKHPMSTPFQIYAGFGPKEGRWRAGLGIYTPAGSTLAYGREWSGRYSLTDIRLIAGFIQPTVAYQVTDWLGIGAGFVYGIGYVNLEKDILAPFADPATSRAHIKLESEKPASGIGFNAGIYLQPTEKLSVGVSYRSKVDMKVEKDAGKVTVTNLPDVSAIRDNFAGAGKGFSATLPIPATTSVGVGYRVSEDLTLAADFNFVQWSAYEALEFNFEDKIGGSTTSRSVRDYQDVWIARLGASYRVVDALTLRAGGYFDKSPVRDGYITPETPDGDRLGLTGGLTWHAGEKVDVDLAYTFMNLKKRTQTQEDLVANGVAADRVAGTYHTQLSIVGLGVNFKF
ncbi:MAG TPA: outer membrane protein transport protein [bacterium]|nr:outer membrane protein transport protein [bacterium]